ncbi:hypothetical protein ACSBR1_037402 [Camellia fascicularis]
MQGSMCLVVHLVVDAWWRTHQVLQVIDVYAEILLTEQAHVSAGDALVDKSYFFSKRYQTESTQTMESYVLKNFASSKDCRYIHFPICNQAHWTSVVYDAEDGSWKHFNPMRQRSIGRSDVHYNEALILVKSTCNCCFNKVMDVLIRFFFGLPGGRFTTGGCMMKSSVLNGSFSTVGIGVMLEAYVERYLDIW